MGDAELHKPRIRAVLLAYSVGRVVDRYQVFAKKTCTEVVFDEYEKWQKCENSCSTKANKVAATLPLHFYTPPGK